MSTTILTHEKTLGPLTHEQRTTIMRFASELTPSARRIFRHLLILAQERGLDETSIGRAAAQAHEHDAG